MNKKKRKVSDPALSIDKKLKEASEIIGIEKI